jgi:transcriptional regulator with XRE-family HTH domain
LNDLGNFLRKLRGKTSLRESAAISGLSHTYIRDLELGINRSTKGSIQPSPETLEKLARTYNFPYQELMKVAGYIHSEETDKELVYETYFQTPSYDLLEVLKSDHVVSVGEYSLTDKDVKIVKDILETMFLKYEIN